MKILFNTATLFKGGGVQVAASYIHEFRYFKDHEYAIVLSPPVAKIIDKSIFPSNFTFYDVSSRPATEVFSFRQPTISALKSIEKQFDPDVVITSGGPSYWRPKTFHILGYNLPHYIYGDSPFFDTISLSNRIKRKLKGILIKYFYRRDGDAYIVQTDDVNERLRSFLKRANVHTVTNTYSSIYEDDASNEEILERDDRKLRVLTLSSYYPHKNLEIIADIAKIHSRDLGKGLEFIVTLPDDDYKKAFPDEIKSFVKNVGPVSPKQCPGLYKACDIMFLPSLLECFSASYVEAMKMKVPIVTTDLPFAKTVCGSAALYYIPLNANDAFYKLKCIGESKEIKEKLIKEGTRQLESFLTAYQRAEKVLNLANKNTK